MNSKATPIGYTVIIWAWLFTHRARKEESSKEELQNDGLKVSHKTSREDSVPVYSLVRLQQCQQCPGEADLQRVPLPDDCVYGAVAHTECIPGTSPGCTGRTTCPPLQ